MTCAFKTPETADRLFRRLRRAFVAEFVGRLADAQLPVLVLRGVVAAWPVRRRGLGTLHLSAHTAPRQGQAVVQPLTVRVP